MAQPKVIELGERRMRVQDEAYREGWYDGEQAGYRKFLSMRDSADKWRHSRRMSVHQKWFWTYLAGTVLLAILCFADAEPCLHDFLLVLIGAASALAIVHLRRWDKHREEYQYLKHRQRS